MIVVVVMTVADGVMKVMRGQFDRRVRKKRFYKPTKCSEGM